jgi:hypothetical protein
LDGISSQLEEITDKIKKMLRIKNPSHPSLRVTQGWSGLRSWRETHVLSVSLRNEYKELIPKQKNIVFMRI